MRRGGGGGRGTLVSPPSPSPTPNETRNSGGKCGEILGNSGENSGGGGIKKNSHTHTHTHRKDTTKNLGTITGTERKIHFCSSNKIISKQFTRTSRNSFSVYLAQMLLYIRMPELYYITRENPPEEALAKFLT